MIEKEIIAETPTYRITRLQHLESIEVIYTPEEQELINKVLALLDDQKETINITGSNSVDTQILLAKDLVYNNPELQKRLQDAGIFGSFNTFMPIMQQRLNEARRHIKTKR